MRILPERSVDEMNAKSGPIQQFKRYSQFTNLKEFNTHIEMWLLDHKHDFTKSELIALKRLIRYSAKIPGLSNAKMGTILKTTHNEYNGNGISRSTFKRMLTKATSSGILTIQTTDRKNGLQSSNLYIFNRCPTNEPPTDAKTIEEFWQMTTIAAYRNNREKQPELVLSLAIASYKQLARKLKTSKNIRNPLTYYYGILNRKFENVYFEELYEMGFPTEVVRE